MICELAEVAEGAAVSGTGVWAAAVMFFTIRMVLQRSGIRDQGSEIRNQRSEIRGQRSGIRDAR